MAPGSQAAATQDRALTAARLHRCLAQHRWGMTLCARRGTGQPGARVLGAEQGTGGWSCWLQTAALRALPWAGVGSALALPSPAHRTLPCPHSAGPMQWLWHCPHHCCCLCPFSHCIFPVQADGHCPPSTQPHQRFLSHPEAHRLHLAALCPVLPLWAALSLCREQLSPARAHGPATKHELSHGQAPAA